MSLFDINNENRHKRKAQSHCDIFRQRGVEVIDRPYNKWFPTDTLSEEFKPFLSCFILFFCNFLKLLVYDKSLLHWRKQCQIAKEL